MTRSRFALVILVLATGAGVTSESFASTHDQTRYAMTLEGGVDIPPGVSEARVEKELRQRLGSLPEFPDTSIEEPLCALGALLSWRGPFREAKTLLAHCVRLRKRMFGGHSLETAAAVSALGVAHASVGKVDEARTLQRRALAIREARQGNDGVLVATSLQRLGNIEGNLAAAAELYERALVIQERAAGPSSLEVARLLNNIGLVRYKEKRYAEAEELESRALAIKQRQLGMRHPDLAVTFQNLAAVMLAQGKAREAEALLRRAIAFQRRGFGRQSAALVMNLHNLASSQAVQSRFDAARATLLRALRLEKRSAVFDPGDQSYTLSRLAALSWKQKKLSDAATYYEAALEVRESDPDKDGVVDLMRRYAGILRELGRVDEAERVEAQADAGGANDHEE